MTEPVQDDEPATCWQVDAIRYPFFHPKDAPELVAHYAADNADCERWDDGRRHWIRVAPNAQPWSIRDVDSIFVRSAGVTKGRDMPGHVP